MLWVICTAFKIGICMCLKEKGQYRKKLFAEIYFIMFANAIKIITTSHHLKLSMDVLKGNVKDFCSCFHITYLYAS